jgi:hypothetical protein
MGYPKIVLADDQHQVLEIISKLFENDFDVIAAVEKGRTHDGCGRRLDPSTSLEPLQ